jgi:hypothetical protein
MMKIYSGATKFLDTHVSAEGVLGLQTLDVEVAVVPVGTEPLEADFKDAVWVTKNGESFARVLVGPTSDVGVLDDGIYKTVVKIFASPENIIEDSENYFEVVPSEDPALTTAQSRLRMLLGERIPLNATDNETFFTNEEIADLLTNNGDDLNAAALEGWTAKLAEFAKLVDREETGSSKKFSQMFKHAQAMVDKYGEIVTDTTAASVGHVVGRVAVWGDDLPQNRIQAVSATYRGLSEPSDRLRFAADHPDTYEADDSYPASTPQAG